LILGTKSINYKRVRLLHQSEGKNVVNLGQRSKGGIVYDKTIKNNNPKGWSAEGIKMYNALHNAVKKDGKTHKTFTMNSLAKRKAQLLDAVQTRKRENVRKSKHTLNYWIVKMTTAETRQPVPT
jgi:hypothetical protein